MKTMKWVCVLTRILFAVIFLTAFWQIWKSYSDSSTDEGKSILFAKTNYVNEDSVIHIKTDIEKMQDYLVKEAIYPINTIWSPVTKLEVYVLPTVLRSGSNVIINDDLEEIPKAFFYYNLVYDPSTKKVINVVQSLECNLAFVGVVTQNHDPEFTDFAEIRKYHLVNSEMFMRWFISQNFEPFTDYNEQHYKNYANPAWSYLELKSLYSYAGIYYFLHSCLLNQAGHPTKQGDKFVFQGDDYITNNAVIAHHASKQSQLNIVMRFPPQATDYMNNIITKIDTAQKIIGEAVNTNRITVEQYPSVQKNPVITERSVKDNKPSKKRARNSVPVNILAQPLNLPLILALPTYSMVAINISEIKENLNKIMISPIFIFSDYYKKYMLSTVKEHNMSRQLFAFLYFLIAFLSLEQCCRSYSVHKIIITETDRLDIPLNFFLVSRLYIKNFWRFLLPTSFKAFQTATAKNLEKFELNRLKNEAKKIWEKLDNQEFKKRNAAQRLFNKVFTETLSLIERREALRGLKSICLDWQKKPSVWTATPCSTETRFPLNDSSLSKETSNLLSNHEKLLIEVRKNLARYNISGRADDLSNIQLQSLLEVFSRFPKNDSDVIFQLMSHHKRTEFLKKSSEFMQAVRSSRPDKILQILGAKKNHDIMAQESLDVDISGLLQGCKIKVVFGKISNGVKRMITTIVTDICEAKSCEFICCNHTGQLKSLSKGGAKNTIILIYTLAASHQVENSLGNTKYIYIRHRNKKGIIEDLFHGYEHKFAQTN